MVLRRFFHKKRQRDSCGEFRNWVRDFHDSSFSAFGLIQKQQKIKHGENDGSAHVPALSDHERLRCFARSLRARRHPVAYFSRTTISMG